MEPDRGPGRWLSPGLAAILGLTFCAILARYVQLGEGNLAWDDADYLRRGLRVANIAEEQGGFAPIREILRERPKPPLLAAWIAAWASVIPRGNVVALIEAGSVLPFGLLMAAVILVSRRQSPLIAALALASSPLTIAFGAKVMVETFLGLWILLAIHFAALVLDNPTRLRRFGLGASIGLAMMTKLTVALLLPAPAIAFLIVFLRRFGLGRTFSRMAITVLIPTLLIAGPWYVRNGRAAVDFARFSSRYNVEAEGRSDRTPTIERLESMASRVVGWPAMIAIGIGLSRGFRRRVESANPLAADFTLLATLGALGGATILLIPAYFDPRFLLPIWPSLAVACSGMFLNVGWAPPTLPVGERWALPTLRKVFGPTCLSIGLANSVYALSHEPRSTTPWAARSLIDQLVTTQGVRTIANVGNTADWNVCKTGLLNELRRDPGSCFVLHDLSAEDDAGFLRRVRRMDAVVVLDPSALPTEILDGAPGLNRASSGAGSRLRSDPEFAEVPCSIRSGLPPLAIFVKKSKLSR